MSIRLNPRKAGRSVACDSRTVPGAGPVRAIGSATRVGIRTHPTEPVAGRLAGFPAPGCRTPGHAGAIGSGPSDTARAVQEVPQAAGVRDGARA